MKRFGSWKKTVAFLISLALVAGTLPANVGGLLTGGNGIVANAEAETVTWDSIDLKGIYSYHDRESNEIISSLSEIGGIRVEYSGGRKNMQSGFYTSDDHGYKHIYFNDDTGALKFKSDSPITKIEINFRTLPDQIADIKVNNNRWTHKITGTDRNYKMTMSGPAAKTVTMMNTYSSFTYYIQDITSIVFTTADEYQYSMDSNISGGYHADGGLYFISTIPFMLKDDKEYFAISSKNSAGINYIELDPDPKTKIQAVTVNGSFTANTAKDFNLALTAPFINQITLGGNITLDKGFSISRNLDIDLNGKTLSISSSASDKNINVNSGTLTFKDSKSGGTLSGVDKIHSNGLVKILSGRFDIKNGFTCHSDHPISWYVEASGGLFKLYDSWLVDGITVEGYGAIPDGTGWANIEQHYHGYCWYNYSFDNKGDLSLKMVCPDCNAILYQLNLTADEMKDIVNRLGDNLSINWSIDNANPGTATITLKSSSLLLIPEYEESHPDLYDLLCRYGLDFKVPTTHISGDIYTAEFTFGNKKFTNTFDTYNHVHKYGEPEWEWSYDYDPFWLGVYGGVTFYCINEHKPCGEHVYMNFINSNTNEYEFISPAESENGKAVYIYTARVIFEGKEYSQTRRFELDAVHFDAKSPTCTEDGNIEYWYYNGNYYDADGVTWINSYETEIRATGHSYNEPVWTWNDDNSSASAKFTCKQGDDEIIISAEVTSKTFAPTPKADGKIVYTAKVTLNGREYTDIKEVKTADKVTLSHVAASPASCTEDGNIEYWYDSVNDKYYSDSNGDNVLTSIVDRAEGHKYSEPEWTWNDDRNEASARFACNNCDEEQTIPAVVTIKVTNATLGTDGCIEHIAKVNFEGKEYTNVLKDILPRFGTMKSEIIFASIDDFDSAEFTSENFRLSCDFCDLEGFEINSSGESVHITSLNGKKIAKVVMQRGSNSATIDNINADYIRISSDTIGREDYFNYVTIYYYDSGEENYTYIKIPRKEKTDTSNGNIEYYIRSDGKYFADPEGNTEITLADTVIYYYTKVPAKEATSISAGNIEYYIRSDGKYFADPEGNTEITLDYTVIPPDSTDGSWCSGIDYSYDSQNGVLTLSSNGETNIGRSKVIFNYDIYVFNKTFQNINKIVISEGITSVDFAAFADWKASGFANDLTFVIPSTVTVINRYAFSSITYGKVNVVMNVSPATITLYGTTFSNCDGGTFTSPFLNEWIASEKCSYDSETGAISMESGNFFINDVRGNAKVVDLTDTQEFVFGEPFMATGDMNLYSFTEGAVKNLDLNTVYKFEKTISGNQYLMSLFNAETDTLICNVREGTLDEGYSLSDIMFTAHSDISYPHPNFTKIVVTYEKVEAVAATSTSEGNIEYYIGSDGKYYVKDGDSYTETTLETVTTAKLEPIDISDVTVTFTNGDTFVQTGDAINVDFILTYDGKELVKGQDYEIFDGDKSATQPGTYMVKVKGNGDGFVGERTIPWYIIQAAVNISVNGTPVDGFEFGRSFTVTAPAAPEGQKFSHWEIGGETVSYEADYSFIVKSSVNLTPVYVANEVEVESKPVMTFETMQTVYNGSNAICFEFTHTTPNSYTIEEVGILYATNKLAGADTKNATYAADIDLRTTDFDVENAVKSNTSGKVKNFVADYTNHNGTVSYSYAIGDFTDCYVYALGYIKCKDNNGNSTTLFTDFTALTFDSIS